MKQCEQESPIFLQAVKTAISEQQKQNRSRGRKARW